MIVFALLFLKGIVSGKRLETHIIVKRYSKTSGFLLLRIFSVAISVSPHGCLILDLISYFDFYVSKIMHL